MSDASPRSSSSSTAAAAVTSAPGTGATPSASATIAGRLAALGISLPAASTPAGAYVPFVRSGDLVFLSGHIARRDGRPWTGQLGRDLDTATGRAAARSVAIELLGTLQSACGGDLERVRRIVKVVSLVHSAADYTEQHLVTNGCSELLGEVFGARGVHARSAVGVAQLPLGACVEIELIAELDAIGDRDSAVDTGTGADARASR